MTAKLDIRIAVVGAGISGITAAHVFAKNGYEVVVFEKFEDIGGVWAVAYPEVRVQNIAQHYRLSDFPWPFTPDFHPTATQIQRYWREVIAHFHVDVRLNHEVLALEKRDDGWLVRYRNTEGVQEETFGYVVVSSGQYTEGKYRPDLPGQAEFGGEILTERDIKSLDVFDGKRVVIVGFGKSAVDMAAFAAARSVQVHHVFREARWLIPERLLGVHMTYALFNRFGTVMIPSWAHPTKAERVLHGRLSTVVSRFWKSIESLIRFMVRRHGAGRDAAAKRRLKAVQPRHGLVPDMRSAAALAPESYYRLVAEGSIQPELAEVSGFSREAVQLGEKGEIVCDLVVLSVGSKSPAFPFMPDEYRRLLEAEEDGVQLYRHLVHPRIPLVGFAGFNHGFMHVPSVEVGSLWLCAQLRGELELPSVEEMEASIERIRSWKRAHITFEPSRSCATNTRFHQYLDILLKDLGVSPYRKMPNIAGEIFSRYNAADYRGVYEEYAQRSASQTVPRRPLPFDT